MKLFNVCANKLSLSVKV